MASMKEAQVGFVSNIPDSADDFCSEISTPPILDMGECLKERKGDLFSVKQIVDREIPF